MKVYNLENIKSATELKHWTEVINMNERFYYSARHFYQHCPKAASCFYFFIPCRYRRGYESIAGF